MNIITKFTLSTGVDVLLMLTKELAIEKYSSMLEEKLLASYIAQHFNKEALIAETNNMSNQWLVVYVDDQPAGYARITSKGKRPRALDGKRAIRIADFGVLRKYQEAAVKDSLIAKCFAACRSYEGIWINEHSNNPLLGFFESKGFSRQEEAFQLDELPVTSVCLIA
ncbi:Acetyltransferase (GNAT) domain-containing protein [Chitinophaga sp. YR627]|uniref:GNAT family N-acetyltransferase n=1 Tax=Chitinophaga sp. YR627 TaxID=1881041 RepID=UPI0008F2F701|nr:GNAT family N-acetyltransferase [Chitinophaga sp. YR627]SFP00943.1 Acetyltransferase (GNAT) domain-containing protein [Chitinophaga sp. YR627]